MDKYIYINVDTNDDDYVGTLEKIDEETILKILPVINAIKDFKAYKSENRGRVWNNRNNYPNGEVYRPDLGEKSAEELYGHLSGFKTFDELCPYCEYGFHTIEDIMILELDRKLM